MQYYDIGLLFTCFYFVILQFLNVICYNIQVGAHWRRNTFEGLIHELHFFLYFFSILWTYFSVIFIKKLWCVFLNLIITQKFQLITIDIVVELFLQIHVVEEFLSIIDTIEFLLLSFASINIWIVFMNFTLTIVNKFLRINKCRKEFWLFYKIINLSFDLSYKFLLSSSEFLSSIPASIHVEVSSIRIIIH